MSIKAGDLVNYHTIMRLPASIKNAKVLKEPFDFNGELVTEIEGKSGVVSLDNLVKVEAANG